MARPVSPGRIVFDNQWLNMPLTTGGGYDSILTPIKLEKHTHDAYELTYLADGEVTWELESGKRLHLSGGSFAIVNPKVLHQGEWEIIRPCKLFWLIIDPLNKNALQYTTFTHPVLTTLSSAYHQFGNSVYSGDKQLYTLFANFLKQLILFRDKNDTDQSRAFARSLICQILLKTLELMTDQKSEMHSPEVCAAISFINMHFSEQIGVVEIAEFANTTGQRLNPFIQKRNRPDTGRLPAAFSLFKSPARAI